MKLVSLPLQKFACSPCCYFCCREIIFKALRLSEVWRHISWQSVEQMKRAETQTVRYYKQSDDWISGKERFLECELLTSPCCSCVLVSLSVAWREWNQLDATQWFIGPYESLNMFRALLCPSSGARDYTDGLSVWPKHVERFIRSNKPLCSIELVLFSPCHRRCTVKHSPNLSVAFKFPNHVPDCYKSVTNIMMILGAPRHRKLELQTLGNNNVEGKR